MVVAAGLFLVLTCQSVAATVAGQHPAQGSVHWICAPEALQKSLLKARLCNTVSMAVQKC